jgi:hypothetical protein
MTNQDKNKILNKITKRYVLKTGKIGKRILKERKEKREQRKAEKIARRVVEQLEQIEQDEKVENIVKEIKKEIKKVETKEEKEKLAEMIERDIERMLDQVGIEDATDRYTLLNIERDEKVAKLRNRLHKKNDLSAGFDLVEYMDINAEDHIKIEQIIDNMPIGFKALIQINFIDKHGSVKEEFRTLNYKNLKDISGMLYDIAMYGGFRDIESADGNYGMGSDNMADLVETIKQLQSIKLIELYDDKQSLFKRSANGKFFKYMNSSDIDLTRYQIIRSTDDQDMINENCLIYALSMCPTIDIEALGSIKVSFEKGAYIAKNCLYEVSKIINHSVHLHQYTKRANVCQKIIQKYNKCDSDKIVHIALFDNHYFIYEDTPINMWAINRYNDIKDTKGWEQMSGETYEGVKCDSLSLIGKLYKYGVFKESITLKMTNQHTIISDPEISLENIHNEQAKYEYVAPEKEDQIIFFADTETDTTAEHVPLMIGVVMLKEKNTLSDVDTFICQKSNPKKIIFDFLNQVVKKTIGAEVREKSIKKKKIIVYFHNLKYDFGALVEGLSVGDRCKKESNLYNAVVYHKGRQIELRDSLKMAPIPIYKFNQTFKLGEDLDKKEAIAYRYYNMDNLGQLTTLEQYKEYLKPHERLIFDDIMKNSIYKQTDKYGQLREYNLFNLDVNTGIFCPYKYYEHYLKYDCLVLCEGMKKLNILIGDITKEKPKDEKDEEKQMKESEENKNNTGFKIWDYLTISSLTNAFFGSRGCFDGTYKVCGLLRDFISKAVTGGRVHANPKYKKKVIEEKIADYDSCSCYPSAIYRMCIKRGIAMGEAHKIIDHTKLNTYDYAIIKIKITKIGTYQEIPFISYKDESGILQYINKLPDCGFIESYIDIITLKDWEKFHKIEYQFISGVYWNSGYNKKMGGVIQDLYNDRLKAKKDKNKALAEILKLMLNSTYGKTITSKSTEETKLQYHTDKTKFDNYIKKNYYMIKKIQKINSRQSEIVMTKYDMSYNLAHVGAMVLSYSKRILNEVFDIATSLKFPIYYTDTDSIHLRYNDVQPIEDAFRNKYKRELNGDQLGQFHIDFNFDEAVGEIYAVKSIFLGKKCYIDMLEGKNAKGETIHTYHYRLKGATKEGMKYEADKYYGGDMFKLYEHLIDNTIHKMILNPDDKFMVLYDKGKPKTREAGKFTRSINFNHEPKEDHTQFIKQLF